MNPPVAVRSIDVLAAFCTTERIVGRGIATRMIAMCVEPARARGAHQLRGWSSEDKTEAIPMWRALGFGLCPATTYPRGIEVRGYYVTMVL